MEIKQVEESQFTWAIARAVGSSHIKSGAPCQDAVNITTVLAPDGKDWVVSALADGAGSAAFGLEGADLATQTFVQFMSDVLELKSDASDHLENLLCCAVLEIRSRIEALAEVSENSTSSYACTLLGSVSNAETSAFIQIGDGAIITGGGQWSVAFEPEDHEYCNVTTFVTDDDALELVRVAITDKPIPNIVMVSDGLESLLVKPGSNAVHPPLLDHLADQLKSGKSGHLDAISTFLEKLLESDTVRTRTDDDTSIIAIYMRGLDQ